MKEITPDKKREEYVRLAEHLRREVFAIFRMAEELSPEAEELEGRVKAVAVKLKELSDHCEHHIEDMEPAEEEDEEPPIAEELIGKAYEKCLAARDFSVTFLQRTFSLGYFSAGRLFEELKERYHLKRMYFVGDVLCKGI